MIGSKLGPYEITAKLGAEQERQPFALYVGLPGVDPLRVDPRFRELEAARWLPGRKS